MKDSLSIAKIDKLHPKVRKIFTDFIDDCEATLGITLRIVQGLRTIKEQDDIYAQGRTKPGPIVTKARGGSSYHNYGLAIDIVPLEGGKPNWNYDYSKLQPISKKHGLTWGADWDNDGKTKAQGDKDETLVDQPHFEQKFGYNWRVLYKKYLNKDFIPGTEYVNI